MTFTDPRVLLDIAQSIVLVVLWLRKPGQDAAAAVDVLRAHVDASFKLLSERQVKIETRIEHMPTSEEFESLKGDTGRIDERTRGLADGMSTVRAQLNRIETYLLNRAP